MARRARGATDGSWARASPRTAKLPQLPTDNSCREELVHTVLRLLLLKGHRAEQELLGRIEAGQGVTARGFHFDPSVLQEALRQWSTQREITSRMDEPGCTAGSMSTAAWADVSSPPRKRRRSIRFDQGGAELPASPSHCSQLSARSGGETQKAVSSKGNLTERGISTKPCPTAKEAIYDRQPDPSLSGLRVFITIHQQTTDTEVGETAKEATHAQTCCISEAL